MNKLILVLLAISLGFLSSCHCRKQNSKSQNSDEMEATEVFIKEYPVVVSFISKGEGIDHSRIADMYQVIDDFESKIQKEINPIEKGWGREGEKDFYFELSGLSELDQKAFIEALRASLESSPLIFIKEKVPMKQN